MTRYADPRRCPDCFTLFPGPVTECPACHLPLTGTEVVELFTALQQADRSLDALRARRAAALGPAVLPDGAYLPQASPRPHRPSRLRAATVPQILLGLGAVCLLVAALVFLIVTWSWLGVGGRTTVLVVFTLAAAGIAAWGHRAGLRIAAESLSSVALGLLALDVSGAGSAGWLGDRSNSAMALIVGLVVAVAGLAAVWLTRGERRLDALVAPAVAATIGLNAAVIGAAEVTGHRASSWFVAGLVLAGLAWLSRARLVGVVEYAAGGSLALWLIALVGNGIELGVQHQTLTGLWLDRAGWPFVGAALLAVTPALVWRDWWRPISLALAGSIVSLALVLPALDNGPTQAAIGCLAVAAAWVAASAVLRLPDRMRLAMGVPFAGAIAYPVVTAITLVELAAQRLLPSRDVDVWSRGVGSWLPDLEAGHGDPLLVLAVVAVGGVAVLLYRRRLWAWVAVTGALLALATLALYPVPLALPFVGFLVLSLVAFVAADTMQPPLVWTLAGLGLGVVTVATGSTSVGLTLVAAAAVALATGWTSWRAAGPAADLTAAATAPLLALAVWAAADLADVSMVWRPELVALALAALVLPRTQLFEELSGLAALAVAGVAGLADQTSPATPLAVLLTTAGVAVVAHSLLHVNRRQAAWLGGVLLVLATWVRLWDTGVHTVEAYTLPGALVLLGLGLWRLRRHADATTNLLLPGLTLATVPSLLAVLGGDPVSLRALLLGAACLALVLGGVAERWSSPLVVGAAVGLALVLRECGPYAGKVPPWVFIAAAGMLLTYVGVTWEHRLADVRRSAAYVAGLR